MNLGLGNLTTLKSWLLSEHDQSGTSFDTALQILGKGVAATMERFCNRDFGYDAAAQIEVLADRSSYCLPRYPINGTPTIERRFDKDESWSDETDSLLVDLTGRNGMLYFYGNPEYQFGKLRITWAGGFWFDDTEDSSGSQPSGSTALPADLQLAWLQQCAHCWAMRDKLGTPLDKPTSGEGGQQTGYDVHDIVLTDQAKGILVSYRRLWL